MINGVIRSLGILNKSSASGSSRVMKTDIGSEAASPLGKHQSFMSIEFEWKIQ